VWSSLAGSSHPSQPYFLGQLARGLSSTVVHFVASMATWHRCTNQVIALRLACWNPKGSAAGTWNLITSSINSWSTLCLDRDVPEVRWSLSDDKLLVTVPTGEQREVEKLTGALGYRYLRCTCLGDLDRWLKEWRRVINVSKNNAMLFAKPGTASRNPD